MSPLAVPPSLAEVRERYIAVYAQGFDLPPTTKTTAAVEATAAVSAIVRDAFGSTPGPETFIAGGTNHDWAKLVLVYGGWPVTDSNVAVITRWMRQENYTDSWWTRNNPLNLGMGGFATNSNLVDAAKAVANTLNNGAGYREIVAGLRDGTDSAAIEYAIWASPWAGGHYAWGGHWHREEVPVVTAPASAWGR